MENSYKSLVNSEKFDCVTFIFNGTMAEEKEVILAEGYLKNCYGLGFLENTNITLNEMNYNERYAMTYILKDGTMYSKTNIYYDEVMGTIQDLVGLVENSYINIFRMKDGLSNKEMETHLKINQLEKGV